MEMKEYIRILLDLHLAVNCINVLRSSHKGPEFTQICSFLTCS
jgi:hypothetical protein